MKYFFFLLTCIVLAFGNTACSKKNANPTPATSTSSDPTSATVNGNRVDVQLLLSLVNAQRRAGCRCGTQQMPPVPEIRWNSQLEQAAFGHSSDMNTRGYFSHDSRDGRKFTDRITATGYQFTTAGENIANGYTNENAVIQGWLNSEGHCRNIMNSSYTEMGVGRAGNYWVQVFARPR
ncbi:MAG TPA: CAP domain-containing protein [Microscillaceae bacterium]|jgi:uncharacterized protein YkwD|nr:CAP domain-containing protein [Microscillaceae bacterium]